MMAKLRRAGRKARLTLRLKRKPTAALKLTITFKPKSAWATQRLDGDGPEA